MILRRAAVLAAAIAAAAPVAAAAASKQTYRATAYNISVKVQGTYTRDATGGAPGVSSERHQKATVEYSAFYPKVFFPSVNVPKDHDTEWFGRRQHIKASYANTGFDDESNGQRSAVNCSGSLSTDQPPAMFWSSRSNGFRFDIQPVDNLFFPGNCDQPFSINAGLLDVVFHDSRKEMKARLFNDGIGFGESTHQSPHDECATASLTPHSCTQSGDFSASVSFARVCTGRLVYTRVNRGVFSYKGNCG